MSARAAETRDTPDLGKACFGLSATRKKAPVSSRLPRANMRLPGGKVRRGPAFGLAARLGAERLPPATVLADCQKDHQSWNNETNDESRARHKLPLTVRVFHSSVDRSTNIDQRNSRKCSLGALIKKQPVRKRNQSLSVLFCIGGRIVSSALSIGYVSDHFFRDAIIALRISCLNQPRSSSESDYFRLVTLRDLRT